MTRLSAGVQKAVRSHEGKQNIEDAGFRATGTTADESARIIRADTGTWGKAVAATGFKAD